MMISKPRTGVHAFVVLLLALGVLVIPDGSGAAGEDRSQDKGTWQDLVLLYTTDVKGKIDPCG